MNTRITIDLQDERLLRLLRMDAMESGRTVRETVVEALRSYLSHRRENQALVSLAQEAFGEWDNPEDAAYDRL